VRALIRSYVEASVHVVIEIHELGSHGIVVISVRNPDGLPILFNKDGQHPGPSAGDKDVTVFRKGEIFIREGAENVPIRYAHWVDLLSSYTRGIREQSTDAALSMLREVLTGRGSAAADTGGVPLLPDMDEATFTATAGRLLETGSDIRLRQFSAPCRRPPQPVATLPRSPMPSIGGQSSAPKRCTSNGPTSSRRPSTSYGVL
jgi:hypothetical protein